MPEQTDDELLFAEFRQFRAAVAPSVTTAGMGAVEADVRHRRRVRHTVLAALSLALVALPVVAYAGLRGADGPPTGGPDPSNPATVTASPTPLPSASAPARPVVADPRTATVSIPAWPGEHASWCPSGRLEFTSFGDFGRHKPAGDAYVELRWDLRDGVDVDRDGTADQLVTVRCSRDREFVDDALQVLALRPAADGYDLLGTVVTTTGGVRHVEEVAAGSNGQVRVRVADFRVCCGGDSSAAQRQWRVYAWNGSGFAQVSGPTTFSANAKLTDFRITVDKLVLTGDPRRGTLVVTVRNDGGTVPEFRLGLTLDGSLRLAATEGCRRQAVGGKSVYICDVGRFAAGGTRTFRLDIEHKGGGDPYTGGQVQAMGRTTLDGADLSYIGDVFKDFAVVRG
jgi:hypothetical protein